MVMETTPIESLKSTTIKLKLMMMNTTKDENGENEEDVSKTIVLVYAVSKIIVKVKVRRQCASNCQWEWDDNCESEALTLKDNVNSQGQ